MIETRVSLDFGGVLDLGRPGETQARVFIFDLTPWMDSFATGGKVTLLARRPWEDASYPCVLSVDGKTAVWTVLSEDVALPGYGSAELRYEVDGKVILSTIWKTAIGESLVDAMGPVPDPAQPWVNLVLAAADRAEQAAEDAEEACGTLVAEYGKTSWDDICAALADGKYIVVNKTGWTYGLYYATATSIYFSYATNASVERVYITSGNKWYTSYSGYTPKSHAGSHGVGGTDEITPEMIGALPALGESIADPETNIDDLRLTKCYLCGATVIKNGLKGDLPFTSSYFLKVEDFTGTGTRAIQTAYKNHLTNTGRKWRLWNGHGWSAWQEG